MLSDQLVRFSNWQSDWTTFCDYFSFLNFFFQFEEMFLLISLVAHCGSNNKMSSTVHDFWQTNNKIINKRLSQQTSFLSKKFLGIWLRTHVNFVEAKMSEI